MNADERRLNEMTEKIIGCAFTVGNTLGYGFLEKVYENALKVELEDAGILTLQQHPMKVMYKGRMVGDYFADLLVENQVLVELKSAKNLDEAHITQCLNYLKATGLKICLLINFGKRVDVRRVVMDL